MMKIVHSRRRVHTSYMDRFQSPQLNKQIGSSLNLMYLAVPVAYGADSGPKLNVVAHMTIILM